MLLPSCVRGREGVKKPTLVSGGFQLQKLLRGVHKQEFMGESGQIFGIHFFGVQSDLKSFSSGPQTGFGHLWTHFRVCLPEDVPARILAICNWF